MVSLAISFFTFEEISYLVDADAGKTKHYTLLDYALFVAYFPHLIAGPIVRHNDLIPQFHALRPARNNDLATGITLFTIGLAKKTLIADNLAPFVDGKAEINHGDTFYAVVEFSNPIHAEALLGYGNWSKPGSKHVEDQLPLFSKKQMRPVWKTRAQIEANLESRKKF